ncbi:MAG: DegT/DnrJ/EryC1/StrS family aminotransferase [Clostridia bacterium]|nr:DegT/DnrJ/EryC1/StrS family aminotransferase [Clostridia bacterium]
MFRIGKEEIEQITKVIESGKLFKVNSGLQQCLQVEEDLKGITGSKYPIFMTSGHAALVSALVGLGIGPGDEVIVPAYTYIATAMAVVAAGAIPVLAEVNETLTIDPADIEKKITPRTKAIIPVHIQGFPCQMDVIMKIAAAHNLYVVEDACQSDGGSFDGKRLGTIGDAGAFSFNYYKIVTSGEGGALLTDNKEIYERALIYHDSSAVAFFGNQMEGFTTETFCGNEYRANEISAAIMIVQLSRLDGILKDLRANKKYLMNALSDIAAFIPSNDIAGDCGTTVALQFKTAEQAKAFAEYEGVSGTRPIDTGKHVYKNWDCIMQKRGAFHPLMDPFKMEANKDIIPDYSEDMCPVTLDLLSKVVYLSVNPNDTKEELDAKVALYRKALQ